MIPALSLALVLASAAQAATLQEGALLCEAPQQLAFVASQPHLAGQPGAVVLKRAQASVEFQRRFAEAGRVIALPKTRSDEVERQEAEAYVALASTCALGSAGLVEILERRPIGGLVRIRATYQGQPSELWTFASSVQ